MDTTELFAAARWWLVLMVLGAAATPLTAYLLHRLPDRGYAFTKMIGLLLVSYLFWLLGSLGFLSNTTGSILLALLIVTGLSALALRQMDEPLVPWLKANSRQILTTELLFLLLFALWVWARAQNPTILNTEKPMEFAFLNSVGRSPQFPPLDPWLSGFSISYYYFGYVMISVLARLSAVAEPIAFNLGVAWLVAGAGVGAFGLVYNLIASHKAALRRKAVGFALVAALAIPLAGNGQMLLELLHASGVGSEGFWAWLDVRDINGPAVATETARYETSDWWWWRSSRVIHEYTLSAEEGLEPIAEFPGFSFMLGDMHPHVLALPFAFVSLALALAWWLKPGLHGKEWDALDGRGRIQDLFRHINPVFWLFTAIVLGGLSFLNTWDVLIHLFVVIAAFALAQWRDNGWHSRILGQTLILAVSLVGAAILFYLPFYLGFRSQAGAPFILPMLMRPTRLAHFLIIFGLPLLVIVVFLLSLILKQKQRAWKIALYAGGGLVGGLIGLMLLMGFLIASSPDGAGMVINLSNDLARPLTPLLPDVTWFGRLSWGLGAVANIVPAVIGARLASPGVTLLLGTIIGLVVMWYVGMFEEQKAAGSEPLAAGDEPLVVDEEPLPVTSDQSFVISDQLSVISDEESPVSSLSISQSPSLPVSQSPNLLTLYPALPFVLLLVVTGALLTLGPEYVYLKDNFGQRLNTIFKFYYQAWVMLGAAALVALYYLLEEEKWAGYVTGTVYAVGLAAALLFPFYAVQSRGLEYRGAPDNEFRRPATLNGLAHIQNDHPDEYAAIMWLRENVSGTPVLVEAVGGAYSPNYARVSAETGIPAVLGWANHEYQWRGTTSEPAEREQAIAQIYNNTDWLTVSELLMKYDVEYVYVGRTEQADYAPEGLAKFAQYMDVAYQNNSVVIYRWQPN